MLTSLANPKIKTLMQLQTTKHRTQKGKFLIEGLHLLLEALKPANFYQFEYIVYSTSFKKHSINRSLLATIKQSKIAYYEVADKVYHKVSNLENPEGIMAVLKSRTIQFEAICQAKPKICLFCLELQDPGNLGTIFRTAEALGIGGIILSKGTVDPFNLKAIRASMGSILRVPFSKIRNEKVTLNHFRDKGFEIIGTSASRGINLSAAQYNFPLVILIGSEARGLSEKLVANITKFVKIPMKGKTESLNVAIAAGIILYEIGKTLNHD